MQSVGKGTRLVYLYSLLASLMCVLLGYQLGVISGTMLFLVEIYDLDIVWQQLIATATTATAALALFPAGYVVHIIGRKKTILGSNIILTVGSIVTAAAPTKEVVLLGRLITGIGTGIPSLVVPMYMSECAPANIRGRLGTLTQIMINIGVFISALVGGAFSRTRQTGWRYMFAASCLGNIFQFIAFFFAPETPCWLIGNGREEEARAVLNKLRDNPEDVEREMKEIQKTADADKRIKESEKGKEHILLRILKRTSVRRALVLSIFLAAFFQLTGIAAVIFYAGSILKMAGFASENAVWMTTIPLGVLTVAAFIGTCFVEKMGRKILFISANIGLLISLIILGLGFHLSSVHSPIVNATIVESYENGTTIEPCNFRTCDECITATSNQCGFCYDVITSGTCIPVFNNGSAVGGRCSTNNSTYKIQRDFCPTDFSWVSVLGLSLHLFSFGSGMGTIWIIISEVFPFWARSTCSSIATAAIWIFQIIISMTFLSLTEAITIQGTFWLYAACVFVGIIYTFIFLPETRGRTLENIEVLFMSPEKGRTEYGEGLNDIEENQSD